MSNTKGSMLISNANAVGTELVNQLGGTGYKPSEWSDAINLLGISDDDKASALAGITEGTYTGNERGAIKYSNCNAVGAMLNKKFSTNRGFKPVEWESAISKLTPLAEGTVSGSICNIVNGAEDVQLKEWSVNIPANLSGKSSVVCTQTGESLVNINDVSGTITNAYFYNIGSNYVLTVGTYKIAMEVNSTVTPFAVSVGVGDTAYRYDIYNTGINNKNGLVTFEFTVDASHITTWNKLWIRAPRYSAPSEPATPTTCTFTVKNITLYTNATVNTVDLGRTVYGADVDVVNGTCEPINLVELYTRPDNNGITYSINADGSLHQEGTATANAYNNGNATTYNACPWKLPKGTYTVSISGMSSTGSAEGSIYIGGKNKSDVTIVNTVKYTDSTFTFTVDEDVGLWFWVHVHSGRTVDENVYIQIEKGSLVSEYSPYFVPFTFDPITPTPETPLGVSNWWSEQGDSSITYRKDPDIPDPPVQLLNMNNNENNNNEGV